MDQTCILLLLSLSAACGKYVFINKGTNWHGAQEHCRQVHTDLAPISSQHDINLLRQLIVRGDLWIWIGMERNSTDREKWTWSGGGAVSEFFWAEGWPRNHRLRDYGAIHYFRWYDTEPHHRIPFICYSVVVVRERKTWEEALDYCREHHQDLASVASETEMLLIQKELDKNETTELVWVGLRFLSGRWLWVDKQPLNYEAWGDEHKAECPGVKLGCAALRVRLQTQSSGGKDSTLLTNSTVGTGATHSNATGSYGGNFSAQGLSDMFGARDAADIKESAWEAHNCEKRLHFICY